MGFLIGLGVHVKNSRSRFIHRNLMMRIEGLPDDYPMPDRGAGRFLPMDLGARLDLGFCFDGSASRLSSGNPRTRYAPI